jgi:hypothetical protein
MIALASDILLFELTNGESIPFSAELISVELIGETGRMFDAEFIKHASQAVFHYFRHELCRKQVTVAEFAAALEKVLNGFALSAKTAEAKTASAVVEANLGQIACDSGKGCELFFFPRLREEMLGHLSKSPRVLHFRGLRPCVKQLVGARRWTSRCQDLKEQILEYLRHCATGQVQHELALVVE